MPSPDLQRPFAPPPQRGSLSLAALEEEARREAVDRRRTRVAMAAAAVFHILLLLVSLPELAARPGPKSDRKQKVFVMQPMRFQPPQPKQAKPIPKKKVKRIPIPDPTPDDPEPVVQEIEAVEVPDTELSEVDFAFAIPDAPPGPPSPPMPANVFSVGDGVSKPVRVHSPKPPYTEEARQSRVQGVVVLQGIIRDDGTVTHLEVLKGLPFGLDKNALETVQGWRFEPGRKNGVPVPVRMMFTISFSLQ